ncbi:MAG TPA: hypothetical protein VM030_07755 [Acidimicrobiales bacterium]|nr:hypothetical protein [Acidimicrobiales bacterium]
MTLRDFADRYGVTLAVVVALTLVLVITPGNVDRRALDVGSGSAAGAGAVDPGAVGGVTETPTAGGVVAADGTVTAGDGSTIVAPGGTTSGGSTRATTKGGTTAASAGTPQIQLGKGPCRPDGRELGIARYMPPCLLFTGSNGGATGRGVTGDKIKIVRHVPQVDPATQAILEGAKLADEPAEVTRAFKALFRYANMHYETYGREVEYLEYQASGPNESDEAMKADAVKLADMKPFAVFGGPARGILAKELAQRGIICICSVSLPSGFYNAQPPYIFSSLPTVDEHGIASAEYIGKRLGRKNAVFAGDEFAPGQGFKTKPRKYGLIFVEGEKGQVYPEGKQARDLWIKEMARYDLKYEVEIGYLYDPGRNQQDMTNIIATMKSKGVTTVVLLVDPLTPIILTAEATRQQYFPEWFVTGTGLSDTSAAGRIYDQAQWRHAFGVTPLWVTWTEPAKSEGYREFHHGMPGMRPNDEGVLINIYRAPVQQLFTGIHMAGPRLTSDTFAQGLYNYPKTGGTAAAPLVYITRKYPTQIKDFAEVFYKADEPGRDERGEQGNGMMMKADGGKRYQAGQWPVGDPKVFNDPTALAVSDNPPGGGPFPHEQDGHQHPASQRCMTC